MESKIITTFEDIKLEAFDIIFEKGDDPASAEEVRIAQELIEVINFYLQHQSEQERKALEERQILLGM